MAGGMGAARDKREMKKRRKNGIRLGRGYEIKRAGGRRGARARRKLSKENKR